MLYRSNHIKGDKIGHLTFIERAESPKGRPYAIFECECGAHFKSRIDGVKNLRVKSCGCKTKELLSIAGTKHPPVEYHDNGIKKLPILNDEDIRRFWEKVGITAQHKLCWNWQSFGDRYGYFKIGKADYKANRMAYFLYYGVDPKELCVMHSCDNPKCCNPAHLSLGTHADNMRDMALKGRANNGRLKFDQNNISL